MHKDLFPLNFGGSTGLVSIKVSLRLAGPPSESYGSIWIPEYSGGFSSSMADDSAEAHYDMRRHGGP